MSGGKTLADWDVLATRELRSPAENLIWNTPEGIAVKPLYTQEDLKGVDHLNSLPGFAPFTRGPRATMYAGRPWTIR
jgi:methylmalonyl-CoA mutase